MKFSKSYTTTGLVAVLFLGYGITGLGSHEFVMAISNETMQQHEKHIFDNLIVSQHIPLAGSLLKGDYILLMDLTPFATSVEGHSHIAAKIPCNTDGSPKAIIVTGGAPNLESLNLGLAISNGTLDGKPVDLSDKGNSCLYHAELPMATTDIAIVNTSNETLSFDRGGYSVTISVHASAIQHLDQNDTAMTSEP